MPVERAPWFAAIADEPPTLDEAVAIFAAVETFHRKLRPRQPRKASDLNRLIDEMVLSAARVRERSAHSHSRPEASE